MYVRIPKSETSFCLYQVQTALFPFPPPRLSGCCPALNHLLSLWVERPTGLWCILGWCGWWEVTPSTTPTTTWFSSKTHPSDLVDCDCLWAFALFPTLSLCLKLQPRDQHVGCGACQQRSSLQIRTLTGSASGNPAWVLYFTNGKNKKRYHVFGTTPQQWKCRL